MELVKKQHILTTGTANSYFLWYTFWSIILLDLDLRCRVSEVGSSGNVLRYPSS